MKINKFSLINGISNPKKVMVAIPRGNAKHGEKRMTFPRFLLALHNLDAHFWMLIDQVKPIVAFYIKQHFIIYVSACFHWVLYVHRRSMAQSNYNWLLTYCDRCRYEEYIKNHLITSQISLPPANNYCCPALHPRWQNCSSDLRFGLTKVFRSARSD